MLEGKNIDVLGLKTKLSKIGRYRSIDLGDIKKYRLDGTKLDTAIQTKILTLYPMDIFIAVRSP